MWNLLERAPKQFDQTFLQWLREMENYLSIAFADWYSSRAEIEEVQEYIQALGPKVPDELLFYYQNVYPFGQARDGANRWAVQMKRYKEIWGEYSEEMLIAAPPIWPIDCFHKYDVVGFVSSSGDLAVIRLDPRSGRGSPIAAGLRNYFLVEVAVQILAEESISDVDFDRLRSDPKVISLSGWPANNPPKQVALNMKTSS